MLQVLGKISQAPASELVLTRADKDDIQLLDRDGQGGMLVAHPA
jgi:hypothetical protein